MRQGALCLVAGVIGLLSGCGGGSAPVSPLPQGSGATLSVPPGFIANQLVFDDTFHSLDNWNYGITNNAANGYPWGGTGTAPDYGSGMTDTDNSTNPPRSHYDDEYFYPSQVWQTSQAGPTAPAGSYSPNGFSPSGSGVSFTAQYAGGYFQPGDGLAYSWYSGMINTYGKLSYGGNGTHVFVQVRAQLGAALVNGNSLPNGAWNSVPWSLPAPGSSEGGNADFEFETGYLGDGNPNSTLLGIIESQQEQPYTAPADLAAGYHVYGIDWVSGQSLSFYVDGVQASRYTMNVPATPHFLVLGLQVANSNTQSWHSWDQNHAYPMTLHVSEVQVYQQ